MPRTPTATAPPVRELKDLTRLVQRAPGFPEILAALKNGRAATIDGAWGSAAPLAAAAAGLHAPTTLLIVLAHVGDLDDFADDVATFAGARPEVFPAWDRLPREAGPADEVFGRRLRVIKRLAGAAPPRFVVAPMQALLQPVPTPEVLARTSRVVRVGEAVPIEELTAWLAALGMTRVEVVEVAGEFSLRGGILDVFPPDLAEPVRLEFFGDDVESIRPFDPETQRSLGRWDSVALAAVPPFDGDRLGDLGPMTDYLPPGTWVALVEPNDLREEGRHYLGRADDTRGLYTLDKTFARLLRHPSVTLSTLAADS
ncbi:MAG TPA: transcription-repair coupling factor, partial [Isosphaeraceae bacterium]